ncbi:MAG TPA: C4-dicarboxylate TRAP transporter substrate-binding protein [Rhizobiaceae bacterium]|nr:C4-dicarboxylate TRAP transporter substrate-binding protein [Rhizobiaceae bacterium]
MNIRNSFKGLALAASLLAMVASAQAVELRIAAGAPPSHPASDPMYKTFIDSLASKPELDITAKAMGLEVSDLRSMMSNLQSNVIDVGNILTSYYAADFPQNSLVGDLAPLGKKGLAMTGAVTEYTATCAECLAEFDKLGTVYLGTGSTPTNWIHTTKPVNSVADLKGLRVRAGAAPFVRWAEAMGAAPQQISFNEEFEALSTGLLDGTIAPPTNLAASRLFEVIKYIIPVPIGTTHAAASFTFNKDTWLSLTPEQRAHALRSASKALASFEPAMRKSGDEAVAKAKEMGITFVDLPADLEKANNDYEAKAMADVAEVGRTRYKIADSDERVKRFAALVEKWNGLITDEHDDPEKMADLMHQEIWSKIDLENYVK